jgi:hypothetical protein
MNWVHHVRNLSGIKGAVADGERIETQTFKSVEACKAAVDYWRGKWGSKLQQMSSEYDWYGLNGLLCR